MSTSAEQIERQHQKDAQGQPVEPLRWALSIAQLKLLSQDAASFYTVESGTKTTGDVVKDLVKRDTAGTGMGYALLQNKDTPLVAEVMVSHIFDESFLEFCLYLVHHLKDPRTIWVCALALFQCEDGSGPSLSDQIGPAMFESPFAQVVRRAESMVVVQTPTAQTRKGKKQTVYDRLWCVLEMAEAIKCSKSVKLLGHYALDTTTKDFNPKDARCGNPSMPRNDDEIKIRAAIDGLPQDRHGHDGWQQIKTRVGTLMVGLAKDRYQDRDRSDGLDLEQPAAPQDPLHDSPDGLGLEQPAATQDRCHCTKRHAAAVATAAVMLSVVAVVAVVALKAPPPTPATPPPTPAPVPPPPINPTHYGDPKTAGFFTWHGSACQSGEKVVKVRGASGNVCSPPCNKSAPLLCPSDKPNGTTAKTWCFRKNESGNDHFCGLSCTPSRLNGADVRGGHLPECGAGTCRNLPEHVDFGLCMYSTAEKGERGMELALTPEALRRPHDNMRGPLWRLLQPLWRLLQPLWRLL